MSDALLIQGSDAWKQARCGSLGASRVHEAVARTKSGWGASRANLMATLISERLTGIPMEGFQNAAMLHGTATEPEARAAYAFHTDADVVEVGLVRHPRIAWTHASPDGLVSTDGLLEIKCPNTATHIETLLGGKLPEKYELQMLWQLACTGREWCDFVSYDPRLPEPMRLFVAPLYRDEARIEELEVLVAGFLDETERRVRQLRQRYEPDALSESVAAPFGRDAGGNVLTALDAG